MNRERWNLLMRNDGEKISVDEISQGWHFCADWDGLLIGPGMGEMESCECGNEYHIKNLEKLQRLYGHLAAKD